MSRALLASLVAVLFVAPAGAAQERKPAAGSKCVAHKDARFTFSLERAQVSKAAQMVADITCKMLVVDDSVTGIQITVVTPRGAQYAADEVYRLFVAALEVQGLTARPSGELVIIRRAK